MDDKPPTSTPVPETRWETRADGTNYFQSPDWYRYVGEGEVSSGESWLRFYHPDDREPLLREWRRSLATKGAHVYDVRARIRRYDGVYRWFRIRGAPVLGADGDVLRWEGTCTDIDGDAEASSAAKPSVAREGGLSLLAWRRRFHFSTLERRLFFIVVSGLLPVTLLSSTLLVRNAADQKRVVLESTSDTMRAVLSAVDGELSAIIASLATLAASPRLAAGDLDSFRSECRRAIGVRPGVVNVFLTTPDGQQLVNGAAELGTPLPPVVERKSLEQAVRTGRPAVGDMLFGPLLKMHLFGVRVPVVRDGQVVHVLSAAVTPEAIRAVIARQRIPESGVVGVFDGAQRVVARSLDHEKSVGNSASVGLVALLRSPAEHGWGETTTLEGLRVYTVFHKSLVSGWAVAVGVPVSAIDGPVRQSYLALAGFIVLSILLGLAIASLLARRITSPLRELEFAAGEVGSGRAPSVPRTDLPAVRSAGEALYAAHVEREKLLRSEREARQLAEQANRTKDEFLAMLGHELRNPLNAIVTASELLHRSPDAAVHAQARTIVSRQASHLGKLTDDLLDAGRVMLGKIELDRTPVDLAQIVEAELETLERTGRLAHLRVERRIEPVWVLGDVTRLAQVIVNLLGNALKFTPAGGRLSVALRRESEEAVLSVRDSGVGLEPELLPRVFDLFVQGQREVDRAQGGLGIGLTLVRRLAELHGGSVLARSQGAGCGSEFVVRLPSIDPPADTYEPQPRKVESRSCTIVVVEDNDDARLTLRLLLELDGYRVYEAGDGPTGVERILSTQPDVAIVDVGLPGMDGFAVAREVRLRAKRSVRLIALTGYGRNEENPRRPEFDAYMVKPVEPGRLRTLLKDVTAVGHSE